MSHKPGRSRVFCLTLAVALVSGIAVARAANEHALERCHRPQYTIDKLICSDANLVSLAIHLETITASKATQLEPQAAKTLEEHQAHWVEEQAGDCIKFRITDFSDPQVAAVRKCVAEKLEARQRYVAKLPTDVEPKAPYVLSAFERAMLADGPYPIMSYKHEDERSSLLEESAERVVKAIIPSSYHEPNATFYFTEAMDGGPTPAHIDRNRYLYGWTFQRHAGFQHYFAVVDLETGAVVLADSMPGKLVLFSKTCTSEDFKHYAEHLVDQLLYDSLSEPAKPRNVNHSRLADGAREQINYSALIKADQVESDRCQ